jgi:hypothetical protein
MDAAAARLGISREAVRKRLERGTLKGRKINGQWSIELPDDADEWTDCSDDTDSADGHSDTRTDDGRTRTDGNQLAAALRDEVAFLRRELETRDEEIRRRDHIIAGLVQRIPELPAGASERPESNEKRRGAQDLGFVYRVPEPPTRPWWKFW